MLKKLLYIIPNDRYFYSHRYELAQYVQQQGFEVAVAAKIIKSNKKTFLDQTIKHFDLKFIQRSGLNPIYDLVQVFQLCYIFYKFKPEIIHAVTLRQALISGAASKFYKKHKIIYSLGGLGYLFTQRQQQKTNTFKDLCFKFLKPIIALCFRWLCVTKNSKIVLQNNDDAATLFKNKFIPNRNNIEIIKGNGIKTAKYNFQTKPNPSNYCNIVFASRMLKDKGVIELINALKILKSQEVKFKAIFCGALDKENPSSITRKDLATWSKQGLIKWLGHVSNIVEVYKNCDIAVLPSYREGLPQSLLEAASCGLAIVCTDVPGCREIVQHNITGLLVPPFSAKKLALALQELIESPKQRYALGNAAKEYAEQHFSSDIIYPQFAKLYGV